MPTKNCYQVQKSAYVNFFYNLGTFVTWVDFLNQHKFSILFILNVIFCKKNIHISKDQFSIFFLYNTCFNPFLHPTPKHLFYTFRVYWDPLYIDLIILKVLWNPLQLYLITPKVWVDPVFKNIFTSKVSCDPGGRMQIFNYTCRPWRCTLINLITPKVSTDSGRLVNSFTPKVSTDPGWKLTRI
jgi:hypothetical protein